VKYPGYINPDRMQSRICQALKGEGMGEKLLDEQGVLLLSDGNILELDRGDSCPAL